MKYNFTSEELHFKLLDLILDSILLSFTGKLISQTIFSLLGITHVSNDLNTPKWCNLAVIEDDTTPTACLWLYYFIYAFNNSFFRYV